MDLQACIQLLAGNGERIQGLVTGLTQEQARWKPDAGSWSILEVINHLYDEEREDFRVRLDIILHRPGEAWPPIDPEGWVTSRHYNQRDLDLSLANFLQERQASMDWLARLQQPDWDATVEAFFGSIRAGDMMAAWLTHDHLHMRQLVELHRGWALRLARGYQADYAGDW